MHARNIALYASGTTNFDTQGLGILRDALTCESTETAATNGNITYTLELTYPIGGYLADQLTNGNLIRAQVGSSSDDYMIFEIVNNVKADSGTITVYADAYPYRILRMSFDNGGIFGKYGSVQDALTALKSQIADFPSDFQLISGVGTAVDLTQAASTSASSSTTVTNQQPTSWATFGDALNEIMNQISGQVEYGVKYIRIYSVRGADVNTTMLRDDKNTNGVSIKTDTENIVNRIIPMLPVVGTDGNATGTYKVGSIVTSSVAHNWINFWSAKVVQVTDQNYANNYFNITSCDRPTLTATVTTSMLDQDLSDIHLFDRLTVYSKRINYAAKLQISTRVFDNLTGEVSSFSLGSSAVTVFTQQQTTINQIASLLQDTQYAIASANGKNTNYYGGTNAPSNPSEGDYWFVKIDGVSYIKQYQAGNWVIVVSDATQDQIKQTVAQAIANGQDALKNANTAVDTANQSLAKAQTAIDTANDAADKANSAQSNASTALTNASNAVNSANQAIQTANSSSDIANAVKQDVTTLKGGSTATIAELVDGLALKVTQTDFDALKAQTDWQYIGDVGDANKYTTQGKFFTTRQASDFANWPDGLSPWFYFTVDVALNDSNTRIVQRAWKDIDSPTPMVRQYNNSVGGGWTAWHRQADQDWTTNQITVTANSLTEQITSVKNTADSNTSSVTKLQTNVSGLSTTVGQVQSTANSNSTKVTTLQQRADGFDTSISNLTSTKADQTWTTNQIKASADSLNLTIASVQTQVNNSAVGTNLLLGTSSAEQSYTGAFSTIPGWNNAPPASLTAVTAGSTYTYSIYLTKLTGDFVLGYWGYDINKNYTIWVPSGVYSSVGIVSWTFTVPNGTSYIVPHVVHHSDDFACTAKEEKLEKGSYATDWSANPADNATVTSVTTLSATVDGLATTVSGKVDNTTYTSKMTQLDNAISTKVESSTYNSKMTQLDNAISTKVESSTYNTEVTQLSNMINSKVSLNDITVGGTNLIPLGNIITATSTQISYDSTNDIRTITVANGAGGAWGGGLQNNAAIKHEIPWGQSYTYSVEIKPSVDGLIWNSDTNTLPYGVSAWNGNDNDNVSRRSSNSSMGGGRGTELIPNVWNKVWVTIINSDSRNSNKVSLYDNSTICVANTTGSTVTVLFRHFKGELGNVPTDYSPAPDDIYSQIQQLSDNINLRVQKNDVINQINVSSESILIAGNKIHITGSTTIDDAAIGSAKISTLSASKVIGGTLDFNQVTATNINANSITSGTLKGVAISQTGSTYTTVLADGHLNFQDQNGNNSVRMGPIFDTNTKAFVGGGISITEGRKFSIGQGNTDNTNQVNLIAIPADSVYNNPHVDLDNARFGFASTRPTFIANWLINPIDVQLIAGVGGVSIGSSNGWGDATHAPGVGTIMDIKSGSIDTYKKLVAHSGLLALSNIQLGANGNNPGIQDFGGTLYIGGTGGVALGDLNWQTGSTGGTFTVQSGGVKCYTQFNVYNGSKNAAMVTRDGVRLTPAYETAENYVGDIGEDNTGSGSQIRIFIDPLYFDMVNTANGYHVFVTPYSNSRIWVTDRLEDSFIVHSDQPNVDFSWEIKVHRRGYESERLEKSDMTLDEVQQIEETGRLQKAS